MDLDTFVKEALSDVERFKAYWVENNQKKPDLWPAEMNAGEWFEQFLTFVTMEMDEDAC